MVRRRRSLATPIAVIVATSAAARDPPWIPEDLVESSPSSTAVSKAAGF